nr:MAG TPA: hypothetical protein [Caudoviricetes sp.]
MSFGAAIHPGSGSFLFPRATNADISVAVKYRLISPYTSQNSPYSTATQ